MKNEFRKKTTLVPLCWHCLCKQVHFFKSLLDLSYLSHLFLHTSSYVKLPAVIDQVPSKWNIINK